MIASGGESLWQALFVTLVLGGGAAIMSGRAIAQTWRSVWQVPAAMLLLGGAVRFAHFALFEAKLLSAEGFAADTVFLVVVALAAWRFTRAGQMVRQYYWLYERRGPFGWRARLAVEGRGKSSPLGG